jgi:hypothetical protein
MCSSSCALDPCARAHSDPCAPREVSTGSEGVDHSAEGRSPRASGEVIHALKGRPGHPCEREAIHAQGRPGTIHSGVLADRPPNLEVAVARTLAAATTSNITLSLPCADVNRAMISSATRSEGGDPCDPREVSTGSEGADHRSKGRKVTTRFRGGHSRAPREAIHAIKGGHPRVPREVFHALQGGHPRAPREVFHALHPRAQREVFNALRGRS